jgi:hypothetical protein
MLHAASPWSSGQSSPNRIRGFGNLRKLTGAAWNKQSNKNSNMYISDSQTEHLHQKKCHKLQFESFPLASDHAWIDECSIGIQKQNTTLSGSLERRAQSIQTPSINAAKQAAE